jgi:hypothetical protein
MLALLPLKVKQGKKWSPGFGEGVAKGAKREIRNVLGVPWKES